MRFPPPMRIIAPLLALVFGLGATWFGYRLNLESDLARARLGMHTRADANGRRVARLSEGLLAKSNRDALEDDLKTRVESSQLKIAGIADQSGRIVADSTGQLRGQRATTTPLAAAAALINQKGEAVVSDDAGRGAVISAHPFRIGERDNGWVLLEFDLTEGIAAARADAQAQLGWMALAMALLSLTLWAVLHFGFAARLGRLADSVHAFGEGGMHPSSLPAGGDEVGELASAFSVMAAKLREREIEQVRLEREVLEISEAERRRIGHDLHDGLGQRLTAASMGMNALVAALKAEAPGFAERGEEIGGQIREAIAETRSHSHGLAPIALLDDGLMSALASLAQSTSRAGIVRCVFECAEPVRVADAEVADHLYRIAQEAVNNALKHATPSEIRIALDCLDDTLVLEVDDDGEGFEEHAPPVAGIGLRVMRYRTRLIGGDLKIGSPPAGGTRISCRVKLPHECRKR
jgi:signal transduction histidine kinase